MAKLGYLDQWAQNVLDAHAKPKTKPAPSPLLAPRPQRAPAIAAVEHLARDRLCKRGFRVEVGMDPVSDGIVLVVLHLETKQAKRYLIDARRAYWEPREFCDHVSALLDNIEADMLWNPELPK